MSNKSTNKKKNKKRTTGTRPSWVEGQCYVVTLTELAERHLTGNI